MKDLFDLASIEVWKDIPEWEGLYQASTFGRIKSLDRFIAVGRWKSSILKLIIGNRGYYKVILANKSIKKTYDIHKLIALTFIINPHNYPCINHKNGIKTDNKLENLEWCSYSQNTIHAYKNGLNKKGELHYKAKITEKQAIDIITKYQSKKYTFKMLGIEYGVHLSTIAYIINGKNWSHLKRYAVDKVNARMIISVE